jgi:2-C-methyl-D-erythritol 4-phosphate cytidylyltransferase
VWAIVVAGGEGRRFGEPKQFVLLGGQSVVGRSVAAARTVADGVVVVVPPPSASAPEWEAPDVGADRVVVGGPTRAGSVRAGLAAVPAEAGVIIVHDAARPLATPALFAAVVAALESDGVEGAIPVLPVTDTLKRVVDGAVVATVDREDLAVVQTPQAFVAATLRRAHRSADEATDDASLVEGLGATVCTVAGEPHNLKLTRPLDLVLAEALMTVVAAES